MEYVVYIVFGIIIIVLLIFMYQMSLYNKINDSKIRIEESSSRIDTDLKDKLDLFNQVITITKEEEDLKNSFKELNKIKGRITNSYSLDKTLNESYKELEKILENNSKISKKIMEFFSKDLVYYQNAECGETVRYYLQYCTQYNIIKS